MPSVRAILFQTACCTWTTFAPGVAITHQGAGNVAIGIGNGAVIYRAQFDAADVTDPRDAPFGVGLDDNVPKLLGGRETAKCLDVDLIKPLRFATGGWFKVPAET